MFVFRALLSGAAVLLIGACASVPSPDVTTAWRDPAYKGPPFRKIFVVGLSAQSLQDQRGLENLLVSTLQGAGVAAVPGWQYVPTDRTPDQATMRAAIAQSGADGSLLVRFSAVQTEAAIAYGAGAVESVGANMYVGWYEPGLTTDDYRSATIFTTLFEVRTARPVWTYNPPTFTPGSLQLDPVSYANDVVGRLRSAGLI
jgi:hypothetical protein